MLTAVVFRLVTSRGGLSPNVHMFFHMKAGLSEVLAFPAGAKEIAF